METFILSKSNAKHIYDIVFGILNGNVVWKDDVCVGTVSISLNNLNEKRAFDTLISIDSEYEHLNSFSVGDNIDIYDDRVVLRENNSFSHFLEKEFGPRAVKTVVFEKKPFDKTSFEKYLVETLCWRIYFGFNTHVEFGKGMICTGDDAAEIEASINKDADAIEAIIEDMKKSLLARDEYPDVIVMCFILRGKQLKFTINWKHYYEEGDPKLEYEYDGKRYEDLIEVFFELNPSTEEQ